MLAVQKESQDCINQHFSNCVTYCGTHWMGHEPAEKGTELTGQGKLIVGDRKVAMS